MKRLEGIAMTDEQKALLGDKEAAKRLTELGALVPCPWCGETPKVTAFDRLIVYECACGETKTYPGYIQTKESPVLASAPESAIKEYYHRDADIEARLAWNTRAAVEMEGME